MYKIYLSGPMTGLPDLNYPEFNRVAQLLRDQGNYVYNPAEKNPQTDHDLREAFVDYARFICCHADKLVLLPGWERSKGAAIEKALAEYFKVSIEEWK